MQYLIPFDATTSLCESGFFVTGHNKNNITNRLDIKVDIRVLLCLIQFQIPKQNCSKNYSKYHTVTLINWKPKYYSNVSWTWIFIITMYLQSVFVGTICKKYVTQKKTVMFLFLFIGWGEEGQWFYFIFENGPWPKKGCVWT